MANAKVVGRRISHSWCFWLCLLFSDAG